MTTLLDRYAGIVGEHVVDHLRQLAALLDGARIVHVNSTRTGGGVAEILNKLVPLMQELGLDTEWLVLTGNSEFYECTKAFHNGLQGQAADISEKSLRGYERTNADNAEMFRDSLEEGDFVFIHDPQPAAMLQYLPRRRGRWIWRCHIDVREPYPPVWDYLKQRVGGYDASIFSLPEFAQRLPHPQYMVPPSIDPLAEKNINLPYEEIEDVRDRFHLDPELPLIVQVSRFDRFKDPLGVIEAYRLAKKLTPLQLMLVGGGAADDPEGELVFDEAKMAAREDPDIHLHLLPPDAHRTINAIQRNASIVLQKSIREGFGLTVSEAMWKRKPVIGGDTGGIRLQVVDHHTGFLVRTPEGAALRIRYLLHRRDLLRSMGLRAHRFVRESFLITRHLQQYLAIMVGLRYGNPERMEVGLSRHRNGKESP